MTRWKPPYPARMIRTKPCTTGRARFATWDLALDALIPGLAVAGLTPVGCALCQGVHLVEI